MIRGRYARARIAVRSAFFAAGDVAAIYRPAQISAPEHGALEANARSSRQCDRARRRLNSSGTTATPVRAGAWQVSDQPAAPGLGSIQQASSAAGQLEMAPSRSLVEGNRRRRQAGCGSAAPGYAASLFQVFIRRANGADGVAYARLHSACAARAVGGFGRIPLTVRNFQRTKIRRGVCSPQLFELPGNLPPVTGNDGEFVSLNFRITSPPNPLPPPAGAKNRERGGARRNKNFNDDVCFPPFQVLLTPCPSGNDQIYLREQDGTNLGKSRASCAGAAPDRPLSVHWPDRRRVPVADIQPPRGNNCPYHTSKDKYWKANVEAIC